MTVCGVVSVAAIVPVFPSIVHIPVLQRDTYRVTLSIPEPGTKKTSTDCQLSTVRSVSKSSATATK